MQPISLRQDHSGVMECLEYSPRFLLFSWTRTPIPTPPQNAGPLKSPSGPQLSSSCSLLTFWYLTLYIQSLQVAKDSSGIFICILEALYQWYLDPKSQLPLHPKLQSLLPIVYLDYNFLLGLHLFLAHLEKRHQEEIQSELGLTLETFLISRILPITGCPIPANGVLLCYHSCLP